MRQTTVNAASELYAIFGAHITHAMTPAIMNTLFDLMNLDKVFLAMNVNLHTFDRVMEATRLIGLRGYVFAMPVKEMAYRAMDVLSDEAAIIGEVNCAKNEGGKLTGYNTDSIGFWNAIMAKRQAKEGISKALVLGTGGFARSAVVQLVIQGAGEIVVSNILPESSFVGSFTHFLQRLGAKYPAAKVRLIDWSPELWAEELPGCVLVANGTPDGMEDVGDLHEIFPFDKVDGDAVVLDANYEPRFTRFLKRAESFGFVVVEGLDLLAHQGACSFFIWTGNTVDPKQVKDAVVRFRETKRGRS